MCGPSAPWQTLRLVAYRELTPHPALQPFVDRLWVRSGGGGEVARILPDGCIDLLLSPAGGGAAVGTMTQARDVDLPAGHQMVAVRFRPAGAAPFLGMAAHELTDRRVPLRDLHLRWLDASPARSEPTTAPGAPHADHPRATGDGDATLAAAQRLERLLLARLPDVPTPDPIMVEAVRALFAPSPLAIDRLARHLGFSRQYLARRFRDEVGIGPKFLARIARLHRALGVLQPPPRRPTTLAEAALAAGYFDEAHMDRDFRELAGVTPRQAQLTPTAIRPVLSLLGNS
jgi:AraC-like DNA-binding protein